MTRSVKSSLDYFTNEFSRYGFPAIRLVEFPRYELFAGAFPGLIPMSEGTGFIARYDDNEVKEAFRVVAQPVRNNAAVMKIPKYRLIDRSTLFSIQDSTLNQYTKSPS